MSERASVPCICHALRSCTCPSVVTIEEGRDLVMAQALKVARRVLPHAGGDGVRELAQVLCSRAYDQLNKNPAGES
jgi:hypothetical protein